MLDWGTYILLTAAVGLVTFGLIYLLFAEVFRSARPPEGRISKAPGTANGEVTEEERAGLTRPGNWKTLLSTVSSRLQNKKRRGIPTGEENQFGGHRDEP